MRFKIILTFIFVLMLGMIFSQERTKTKQKSKNSYSKKNPTLEKNNELEIFNKVFNNLNNSYVDSLNHSKIIMAAVDGMLESLDPYTKILRGASKERYEMLAKGKYGGVGMSIDEVRDTVIITRVYEDSPSYFEGIMAGDMILAVDTTNVVKLGKSATIKLLKGEVDTPVELTILRRPGKQKKFFRLLRGSITINDIPYWGLDDDSIGYIKINKFSKYTSEYFKEALSSMSDNGMQGLIIDLRSNGGGLLRQAINILDYLVDRDMENPILVRKGRDSIRNYYSKNNPIIDKSIPIMILQNNRSASASEIVSGVLQDLDRAVIQGQNSFGKGLVQITKTINDSLKLKVTAAKYYLPSGRLIQKYDYLGDGSLIDAEKKDSIYFSINGRKIRGGGGIQPDIDSKKNKMPGFVRSLWANERLFVLFGAEYSQKITDDAFNLYRNYLKNKFGNDYVDLGQKYAIEILNDNSLSYFEKIIIDKEKEIELSLNLSFINQAEKLYNQLNKHTAYENLSNKNYDEIIKHAIEVRKYIHLSDSEARPSELLKNYLTDNNLFFYKGSSSNKKIGKYELYSILSRLLGIIIDLDISKLENYDIYLYDINYLDIDSQKEDIATKNSALSKKMKSQNEVLDWYFKLFYNLITPPHNNIGFSDGDVEYIAKKFKLFSEKEKLVSLFKKFVDSYNFNYFIDGEKEFNNLKNRLSSLPEFVDTESDNQNFINEYLRKKKFNKLVKEMENYIYKNKKKYFFLDENSDWIINGIFREYAKLSIDNSLSVKTSLYLDNEYQLALSKIKDKDEHYRLLTFSR
ncbi:MAG: hypothetical protein CBD21_03090 [bacterium TMED161]|nr:MAG: hypothetical protein CBD21_03090 [bacterium TMED161]